MSPFLLHCQNVTRRHFLRDCGVGLGKIALAGLLTEALTGRIQAGDSLAPKQPPFPAKACLTSIG